MSTSLSTASLDVPDSPLWSLPSRKGPFAFPTPPPQKRLPRAVKTCVCPQCLRKGTGNPEGGGLTVSTPGNSVIPQAGHWSCLNFSLFICQVEEGMFHVARILFSTEVPECLPPHLLTVWMSECSKLLCLDFHSSPALIQIVRPL